MWLAPYPKTNPNLDPNPNPNRGAIFLEGQLAGYSLRDVLSFSKKEKEFYKYKCRTVNKIKNVKNVIIKKSASFSSLDKYSIR